MRQQSDTALGRFMARLGTTDARVAEAIDRHPATVSRIRRGLNVPDGVTALRLERWATSEARACRIPAAEVPSMDDLLGEAPTAAA